MVVIVVMTIMAFFITGALAAEVAASKGHSQGRWFAIGFFCEPFGLLAAGLIENLEKSERIKVLQGRGSKYFARCKTCYELVFVEAKFCRYCGEVKSAHIEKISASDCQVSSE